MKIFRAYCDGTCEHGRCAAAFAYIIVEDNKVVDESTEAFHARSANEAEMRAVFMALESVSMLGGKKEDRVLIYTDFKPICDAFDKGWVMKWMDNGWKNSDNNDVRHRPLWEGIWEHTQNFSVELRYTKRDELGMLGKLKKRVRKASRSLEDVGQADG